VSHYRTSARGRRAPYRLSTYARGSSLSPSASAELSCDFNGAPDVDAARRRSVARWEAHGKIGSPGSHVGCSITTRGLEGCSWENYQPAVKQRATASQRFTVIEITAFAKGLDARSPAKARNAAGLLSGYRLLERGWQGESTAPSNGKTLEWRYRFPAAQGLGLEVSAGHSKRTPARVL
jgi:hypothetical protein